MKYLNELTDITCGYLIMQKLTCKPFSFSRVPGSEQILKIVLATQREGNKDKEEKEVRRVCGVYGQEKQ